MSADPEQALEELLRRIVREEFERLVPAMKAEPVYLTTRQCATRFRKGYDRVREMVKKGELETVRRPWGNGPKMLTLIVATSAEKLLGPGVR